jgi:uncharacterized protein (TIGR00369 family)
MTLDGFTETRLVDPFEIFIGPVLEKGASGEKTFALVIDERHVNARGVIHGGMLMTFADVSMSQTSRAASGARQCSTVSLTCDFVGPGKLGDILESRVRVTRQTRTMVFLSADIVCGDRVLAVATGLWKIG